MFFLINKKSAPSFLRFLTSGKLVEQFPSMHLNSALRASRVSEWNIHIYSGKLIVYTDEKGCKLDENMQQCLDIPGNLNTCTDLWGTWIQNGRQHFQTLLCKNSRFFSRILNVRVEHKNNRSGSFRRNLSVVLVNAFVNTTLMCICHNHWISC